MTVPCDEALGSEEGVGGCYSRESLPDGCVAGVSRRLPGLMCYTGEWPECSHSRYDLMSQKSLWVTHRCSWL